MNGADVLLAVLALGVAILLGRGSHPLVAALLVASALAVSAVLFLPTAMLAGLVGMERVHGLYDLTRATPLDPPEWVHLIVFAWLGFHSPEVSIASWVGENDEDTTRDWALIEKNRYTQEDLIDLVNSSLRLARSLKIVCETEE